ncbi:MAG: ABC transporter substrate-binding protein [Alphaproteobacteria bacterium]|nr:ABC transporter substrate-binding protein [Alphaproteobacteria bacterium]
MRKIAPLAGATALAICFAVSAQAETFRWARGQDATTLDPHAQNSGQNFGVLHQIYEPLVHRDQESKIVPALATSWSITSDKNVWEFKLRPNVKFHNGNAFTADDVIFSINRAKGETSDLRGLLTSVVNVTKVDDLTVRMTTEGPNPLLVNNLTNLFMMDKEWAEANNVVKAQDFKNKEENFAVRNTNGTGPYALVTREADVRTVMRANPNYWGKGQFPLKVTEIVYTPITAAGTRIAALLSGELDFVQDMPVQDITRVSQTSGLRVNLGLENRSIFLGLNAGDADIKWDDVQGKNPLGDKRVRKAMEMAINREAIKTVVMAGQSIPSGTLVPPTVHGYTKDLDAIPTWDINAAKALMTQAGYPNGFGITLHCPNNRYVNDEKICQAVVGFLGQIGVKVNLAARPMAQHSPEIQKDEVDFWLLGWGVPTYDAEYVLSFLYHSREGSRGGWNATRVKNKDMDDKIKSLTAEVDFKKRDATIAEVLKWAKDEALYIPLHNQTLAWGMKNRFNVRVQDENQLFVKYIN